MINPRNKRDRNKRNRKNERGVELVELTLVFPLLMFLVMGMLDAGMAFKTKMDVVQSSRQGARVGSSLQNDPQNDDETVMAVASVLDQMLPNVAGDGKAYINYVVIYDASAADGSMPASCKTTSSSACTHLSRQDFIDAVAAIEGGANPHLACNFCSRDTTPSGADQLGVFVSVQFPSFTGLLNTSIEVTGYTVMRVEPTL
jgi:Flp pilus assembly protein TadG